MAWTFILRFTTARTPPGDAKRLSGAVPTVMRLGYALGAAYLGIVGNAAGIGRLGAQAETVNVARWIFASCLPFGLLALAAMAALIRAPAREEGCAVDQAR